LLTLALVALSPTAHAYEIVTSSWLGGQEGDQVRGMRVAPDGSLYLVAQISGDLPWAGTPTLLNGASAVSSGVYLHLDATGQTVLAYARIAENVYHLGTDAVGHPYIGTSAGLIKLDPATLSVLWVARPDLQFYDLDVAPGGLVAARNSSYTHIFDADGTNERIIPNYQRTFDVAIDQDRQVLYQIGWRQASTQCNPVQIAYLRAVDFDGNVLWLNYDWPSCVLEPGCPDSTCTALDGRPFTNLMADTRGYRVTLGLDGYLYGGYEAAGGNHIMRRAAGWDPNNDNLLVPSSFVSGPDMFHQFSNTKSEHKTVIVRYDPETGKHLLGQEFLTRFWDGNAYAGNSWRIKDGEITVDADGRLYIVGSSASGMPIEGFQGYTPSPGEITFNPWAGEPVYTGGAYVIVMDPTLSKREFTTRLSGGNAAGVAVDFRNDNARPMLAWGGWVADFRIDGEGGGGTQETRLYTKDALQAEPSNPMNPAGAFFAVSAYDRPLTARFTMNPSQRDEPGIIEFDGSNSYDPDAGSLDYFWDFGDGSPQGVGAQVSHNYAAGIFTATLTVANLQGEEAQSSKSVVVLPGNLPDSIGIAFGTQEISPQPGEYAGAVIAQNWNVLEAGQTARSHLFDTHGTATTASITADSGTRYGLDGSMLTANAFLVGSQMGSWQSAQLSFTITGIPYDLYDVYVYWAGISSNRTTGTLEVSDGAETFFLRDSDHLFDGQLTESTATTAASAVDGNEYVVFRGRSGGTIAITTIGSVTRLGPAAVQIVDRSAPDPYAAWLANA
jgi:hypothetical protein